jgi:hypothetical protein
MKGWPLLSVELEVAPVEVVVDGSVVATPPVVGSGAAVLVLEVVASVSVALAPKS